MSNDHSSLIISEIKLLYFRSSRKAAMALRVGLAKRVGNDIEWDEEALGKLSATHLFILFMGLSDE